MPAPPVARMRETPGWAINSFVASIEVCSIQLMQFSGAPAFVAASSIIFAAAALHRCAPGWKLKIIGFLVFIEIRDLNIVVEVGLVTGVIPAITPTGSATSSYSSSSSTLIVPTVLLYLILW
ncbi:MAG: hypothetical protein BWY65_01787 [Firmicutes bacterium ADurb.Bin373]|nr:MAG: hypothetical protein BWY65_01787 [Firmicutes bacterium ADurb.Bin373]